MADQTYYFQVLTPQQSIHDGKFKMAASASASGTTIYNGMVAKLDASGDLVLSTSSDENHVGLFYDTKALTYKPTTKELSTDLWGKRCGIVTGTFEALVGPELFSAGTIAAIGSKLYATTGGKYTTSGSNAIGFVVDNAVTLQDPAGSYSVGRVKFNFGTNW